MEPVRTAVVAAAAFAVAVSAPSLDHIEEQQQDDDVVDPFGAVVKVAALAIIRDQQDDQQNNKNFVVINHCGAFRFSTKSKPRLCAMFIPTG